MSTEALLETAMQALITEAREAHQHAQHVCGGDRPDAVQQVAYGKALGAQLSLAAFLAAVLPDDEDQDPTDMARAYAEGRELEAA